jgi:hypothetical protein
MLFSETNVPTLQIIDGTECIGDSLTKINTNAINLQTYINGLQTDIITVNDTLGSEITNADAVLSKITSLSSQTEQWDRLYTVTSQSSSYIFDGYNIALSAISKSVLLSSSALRSVNSYTTTLTAANGIITNNRSDTTQTRYLSSVDTAVNSITASGFYYGDGSKLIGIVAPTRVYLRFNGVTVNLPDQSQIPTGYWGTNYNVSSITKLATGTYKVNFARSLEDYRYAYFLGAGGGSTPYVACRAPNTNASTYDITILNKRLADNITVDAEEMNLLILYPVTR